MIGLCTDQCNQPQQACERLVLTTSRLNQSMCRVPSFSRIAVSGRQGTTSSWLASETMACHVCLRHRKILTNVPGISSHFTCQLPNAVSHLNSEDMNSQMPPVAIALPCAQCTSPACLQTAAFMQMSKGLRFMRARNISGAASIRMPRQPWSNWRLKVFEYVKPSCKPARV